MRLSLRARCSPQTVKNHKHYLSPSATIHEPYRRQTDRQTGPVNTDLMAYTTSRQNPWSLRLRAFIKICSLLAILRMAAKLEVRCDDPGDHALTKQNEHTCTANLRKLPKI